MLVTDLYFLHSSYLFSFILFFSQSLYYRSISIYSELITCSTCLKQKNSSRVLNLSQRIFKKYDKSTRNSSQLIVINVFDHHENYESTDDSLFDDHERILTTYLSVNSSRSVQSNTATISKFSKLSLRRMREVEIMLIEENESLLNRITFNIVTSEQLLKCVKRMSKE